MKYLIRPGVCDVGVHRDAQPDAIDQQIGAAEVAERDRVRVGRHAPPPARPAIGVRRPSPRVDEEGHNISVWHNFAQDLQLLSRKCGREHTHTRNVAAGPIEGWRSSLAGRDRRQCRKRLESYGPAAAMTLANSRSLIMMSEPRAGHWKFQQEKLLIRA
jgi:hypothetical protein